MIWHGVFDQISIQQLTGALARAGRGWHQKASDASSRSGPHSRFLNKINSNR